LDTGGLKQQARFGRVQGEIVDADLDDISCGAQPCHRKWRRSAGCDRKLRPDRHADRELRNCVEALPVLEQLHVIEDQGDRYVHRGHRGGKASDGGRGNRGAAKPARSQQLRVDRAHPIQRRSGAGQEHLGVVVPLVDRDPCGVPSALGPMGKQRRLPVAGRSDDGDDRHSMRSEQPIDQRGPGNDPRADRRRMKLRFQDLWGRFC
jgi:hypothetical protein